MRLQLKYLLNFKKIFSEAPSPNFNWLQFTILGVVSKKPKAVIQIVTKINSFYLSWPNFGGFFSDFKQTSQIPRIKRIL